MSVAYVPAGWRIVYGSSLGIEGFALSQLSARLCEELGRDVSCVRAENFTPETPEQNVLLLGTAGNNPYIAKYSEGIPSNAESYLIRTVENGLSPKGQTLVIAGSDPSGVLYGAMDFLHFYADRLSHGEYYREKKYLPFIDPLPKIDVSSSPSVAKRGIWTWGRCIYDYRGFLDNMARCKMNTVVIWNDVPPTNGKELVSYAHSRGIKVIWGFSWGWGTELAADITDVGSYDEWKAEIVESYGKVWAPLEGDGIYFQTATECDEKTVNGLPLAAYVVNWVNGIAKAMYEKYPELDIEFGLHATAVKTSTEYLSSLDPRLTVTWEDGGAFPFAYHAWATEAFDGTLELTEKMLALRGENEKAGFVFKGICTLFWPEFMPARDSFVLGEASEAVIQKRLSLVRGDIRTEQAYWLENLENLTTIARRLAASGTAKGSVTILCEDGCFERARWIPCVLFAETLWNTNAKPQEIIRRSALMRDAVFA
ncbi:MAG: hypothetical protein IKM29_03395 [Clostridia bacterium]|nr:hypothetical protein [Clostridia bacterium]